jgi:hypothetical protein
MFGIPYKIMASVLGTAILLAIFFAVGVPLNFIM